MTDQPVSSSRAGPGRRHPGPARAGRDRGGSGHDHRPGLVGSRGHDGGHAGRDGGYGCLRRRASCQCCVPMPMLILANMLPSAEPVERQLRRLLRVGRPRDQPLPRLHGRLDDARGCLTGTSSVVVVLSPAVLAIFGDSAIKYLAEHLALHRHHPGHGSRSRWSASASPHAPRSAWRRSSTRSCIGISIWGADLRDRAPPRHVPAQQGVAKPERHRRQRQPGRGAAHRGLHVHRLGRNGLRQRGSEDRRVNPGRAAVFAVALLVIMYALPQVGMQGVVSPARLQANASSAAGLRRPGAGRRRWAKVMAFALALWVIASTNAGIVITCSDRLRDGEPSRAAADPGQRAPALLHPGHRQRHRRRDPHRHHLGLPAVQLDCQRLQPTSST